MLTYQDFLKNKDKNLPEFLLKVINEHKSTLAYRIAIDANMYDRQQNVTITKYQKFLYKLTGEKVLDTISPNYKLASNFFNRFTTQLTQYLLGNGVTFAEPTVKEKLGSDFDTQLQRAAKYALVEGVSFGFWDLDRLRIFKFTEFAPLYDEENGSLRAGVRFWQLAPNKPLRMTAYEEDGYTEYIRESGENIRKLQPKRPYKLVLKVTPSSEPEIYDGENYPNFPIVPLYANDYRQSELVGIRESIDAYDLIKSGFANDLDGHLLYWIINNAGGMDDADVARVIERIKTLGAAISDDNATVETKSIDIPYASRIAYLDKLEQDLYKDFGALKSENISAGATTATQIKSSYTPLDMKANGLEYMCIEFIQSILRLQGIEDTPIFKRDKIANYTEETSMVLQSASYLDDETILQHLPFLSPEEIENILKRNEEEEARRYKIAEQISNGEGFNLNQDETEQQENPGNEQQEESEEVQNDEEINKNAEGSLEEESSKEAGKRTQSSGRNTSSKRNKNQ